MDPASADPLVPHTVVTADFNSDTLYFNQTVDGSWIAYVADQSTAIDADSASIDFGTSCTTTVTGHQTLVDTPMVVNNMVF